MCALQYGVQEGGMGKIQQVTTPDILCGLTPIHV